MKREIVINSAFGETRAAFLEDRRLVELYVEREPSQRVVGNIYKGRVENVLPGMQAAFVNIGLDRNAFLYVDDALHYGENHNGHAAGGAGNPSIRDILKEGDTITVQVAKEPLGTKGARVVTNLSIPGRYFVCDPPRVRGHFQADHRRNRKKSSPHARQGHASRRYRPHRSYRSAR